MSESQPLNELKHSHETGKRISQPRVLSLLIAGQILSGLGVGINVAAGTIIVADLSGQESWSGLAVTVAHIGAAIVSVPLARSANRYGRRVGLSLGMFIAAIGAALGIFATATSNLWLVLTAFTILGAGAATNLQARFAATDLSEKKHRGRDLSIVVWSTVIGSVTGPMMIPVGVEIGQALGLPGMTGVFLPPLFGQLLSAALFFFLLRPDPLLQARRELETISSGQTERNATGNMPLIIFAIISIALSQFVMTALMAMTPVHLKHHGADLTIIGITISLHIAGMYAISPIFGILADRVGAIPTIIFGQVQLAASMIIVILWPDDHNLTVTSLILLGTGWSAATVAASTLISQYSPEKLRVQLQGRSDMFTGISAAIGATLSGVALAFIGFVGLAWVLFIPILIVVALGLKYGRAEGFRQTPAPPEMPTPTV